MLHDVISKTADAEILTTACAAVRAAIHQYTLEMEGLIATLSSASTPDERAEVEEGVAKVFDQCQAFRLHCSEQHMPQLLSLVLEHFAEDYPELRAAAAATLEALPLRRRPPPIPTAAALGATLVVDDVNK